MFTEVIVRNFALIEEVRLPLAAGLHVLTGETGAGKSILIDAVSLLLGGRATAEAVRSGAESAEVEAALSLTGPSRARVEAFLAAQGLPATDDGTLLLAREVTRSGRSKCRVNDRLVTVGTLATLGELLVDIHGQHEHQSLLRPETHLGWLDAFAGREVAQQRARFQECYQRWQACRRKLAELREQARERARRMERLRFEVEEITAAGLSAGEEERLEEEHQRLAQAETLRELVGRAYFLLAGEDDVAGSASVRDLLAQARDLVAQAGRLDGGAAPLAEQLAGALYQVEEAGWGLRDYLEQLQAEPERLAELEARLALLEKLKYKYGESVAEVIAYGQRAAAELAALTGAEESAAALEEEEKTLLPQVVELAAELGRLRREAAARLARLVEEQLAGLKMERTRFEVALESATDPEEFTAQGAERVEFLISPNPGEELRPLARIASGGEISRIMLALKCILAEVDLTPTLIFDEIDAGIGGRTLQAVAERLAALGRSRQILCVTHAPQIAAMADHHFAIRKEVTGERTRTRVQALEPEARVEELARMLGGAEVTERTRAHAREMLKLAGTGGKRH